MTFADLGIPFPLWEAPVKCASNYAGLQTCSLCHTADRHCFRLSGGDAVMVLCPACQTENGLSKNSKEDGATCLHCGALLEFPPGMDEGTADKPALVCYECLRAGRVAMPKDTSQNGEIGLVDWENATKDTVVSDLMRELLRTPNYITWQGEQWQFDEGQPMIFTGEWDRDDFSRHAPNGDGERLFYDLWGEPANDYWDYNLDELPAMYVFRSATRQKWAAHWDMD